MNSLEKKVKELQDTVKDLVMASSYENEESGCDDEEEENSNSDREEFDGE